MITSRMKKIIRILLKEDGYLTLSTIAKAIDVSTRTVLRELDDIEEWFVENGGSIDKKKGTGIRFLEVEATRQEILSLLNKTKSELIYTPEDRRLIIRAKLLQYDEPTKLYALTGLLKVTESTIGSDLDHLEIWFNNYNLLVIKKPGLGILIKGSETAKRKAIVALIYEHFHVNELIEVISNRESSPLKINSIESRINKEILGLMEVNCLDSIKDIISNTERQIGYQFADNGYIALAIRVAVTLKRRNFWGDIELDEKLLRSFGKDRVFNSITEYLEQHQDNPMNDLPYKELVFLTIHIKGTKLRDLGSDNKVSMIEDFKIIQLVKEFIERAEAETGIYLTDNEELLIGLVKHLRPSLYRIKMDLDIINPLVHEIKAMYPKLFKAVKRSARVIEDKEDIDIPDDEIAYLAIHIGALIHESNRNQMKKYRAVVACVYGIGASSFLTAQINKHFPNITITEVISVMDQDIMNIDKGIADLLITTVPLKEANIPFVQIDPILKDEDTVKINHILDHLSPSGVLEKNSQQPDFRKKMEVLQEYSTIMIKLLDNFTFIENIELKNMKDLIQYVSRDLGENIEEIELLKKAFIQREEKGSTILSKKGMLLLHCRAEIHKEIALQIIKLNETIFIKKAQRKVPIKQIVVMVAPVILNQKILKVLSEISRNIITEGFSDIIIDGSKELVESQLNAILDKYYQNIVSNFEEIM